MIGADPANVDLLVLGAGWTGTFLLPLLEREKISYAATTRDGHDKTIPFTFSPTSSDPAPYRKLPSAKTILIVFPLKGTGQSAHLTKLYRSIHGSDNLFIQLGSTGIFTAPQWNDRHSTYDSSNDRAIAEDELMREAGGAVLNLAGLYGGARDPIHWAGRVAATKEQLKGKKALHMIHGEDVARAVVASHTHRAKVASQRWLLTDLHVYCWWELILNWAKDAEGAMRGESTQMTGKSDTFLKETEERGKWVVQLMMEEGVRGLPRGPETLGRVCDSREFWNEMDTWPAHGRIQ